MENITNFETLNSFLEKLETEKEELNRKIEILEEEKDHQKWQWMKHIAVPKDDFLKQLPCPRIEMKIFGDRYECGWITGIVFPDYADEEKNRFIPFSMTTTSGKDLIENKNPRLPWRDEFHIYSYSRIFNLRMFLTRENDNLITELFVKPEFINPLSDFESKNVIV